MDRYEFVTRDGMTWAIEESRMYSTDKHTPPTHAVITGLRHEMLRLASDLKAKDTENADLIARLERAEKALDDKDRILSKIWRLMREEIDRTDPESPRGEFVRWFFSQAVIDDRPITDTERNAALKAMEDAGILDELKERPLEGDVSDAIAEAGRRLLAEYSGKLVRVVLIDKSEHTGTMVLSPKGNMFALQGSKMPWTFAEKVFNIYDCSVDTEKGDG